MTQSKDLKQIQTSQYEFSVLYEYEYNYTVCTWLDTLGFFVEKHRGVTRLVLNPYFSMTSDAKYITCLCVT